MNRSENIVVTLILKCERSESSVKERDSIELASSRSFDSKNMPGQRRLFSTEYSEEVSRILIKINIFALLSVSS